MLAVSNPLKSLSENSFHLADNGDTRSDQVGFLDL
jgi:hypothetical protein